jgi:hypothetical protein
VVGVFRKYEQRFKQISHAYSIKKPPGQKLQPGGTPAEIKTSDSNVFDEQTRVLLAAL